MEPFQLSRELTRLMLNAVKKQAKEDSGVEISASDMPHEILQQRGVRQVLGAIDALAYLAQSDQQSEQVLSLSIDGFSPDASKMIVRYVFLHPLDYFEFLCQLRKETRDYLASGGEIKTANGSVELRNEQLVLKVKTLAGIKN